MPDMQREPKCWVERKGGKEWREGGRNLKSRLIIICPSLRSFSLDLSIPIHQMLELLKSTDLSNSSSPNLPLAIPASGSLWVSIEKIPLNEHRWLPPDCHCQVCISESVTPGWFLDAKKLHEIKYLSREKEMTERIAFPRGCWDAVSRAWHHTSPTPPAAWSSEPLSKVP